MFGSQSWVSLMCHSAAMAWYFGLAIWSLRTGTGEGDSPLAYLAAFWPMARNMRRAAELIKVPDAELLGIYNSLRPYRSTKAELYGIAESLETKYGCKVNAAFIREAADVYEKRGRLKVD